MSSLRVATTAVALIAAVLLAVAGCPSQRNTAAQQVAQARDDAGAAARGAAAAVDAWQRGRSTSTLLKVQLADARDHTVEAYTTAASVDVETAQESVYQRTVTDAMSAVADLLNGARLVIGAGHPSPASEQLRRQLLAAAAELDRPAPS